MATWARVVAEAPSSVFGRILVDEWIQRTNEHRGMGKSRSFYRRRVEEAAMNSNSNGNSETKAETHDRGALWSGFDIRDVIVFASKQIFERGFEKLNSCYFDFGLEVHGVLALAELFKDVDADKDGRLGINDISLWISDRSGEMDSTAAAEVIRNFKGETGGFLSKLDFVCMILEREMTAKDENSAVATEDLLWAIFVAMDANRDGWISVEDIRRLCRNLKYDLKEDEEKAICCIGGGRGGGTHFCSSSGSKLTSKGVLNFRDFTVFVQKSKVEKNDKPKKLKPCVIQ